MSELVQHRLHDHGSPSLGDPFGSPDETGMVTVSHGLLMEQFPLAQRTVGEIRRRLADRLDLDPQSQAQVDGVGADDDVVVRAGQRLLFVRNAGEKGSLLKSLAKATATVGASPEITIDNDGARLTTPEGRQVRMPLGDLLQQLAPPQMQTCGVVVPGSFRLAYSRGSLTIWVCELPPLVRGLRWIAADSKAPFGEGASYRTVRIALPYVVVFAVFDAGTLTALNEAFFRVRPLESESDELCYPALLNCSKFAPQEGKPLSWICTQKLDRSAAARHRDPQRSLRAGLKSLLECLFETGFNYSSEKHEASSWFSESRGVDPRISSIERWEQATCEDPLFILDVPFLKTGRSVAQVVDRIFKNVGSGDRGVRSAQDLARLLVNHAT